MTEPRSDRHGWEAEMSAAEGQLGDSPANSLVELDRLVSRMLGEPT